MLEKRLIAVPPQLLTTDGTANGKLTVADSTFFKVKQVIFIRNNTLQPIELEIKRIDDAHTIYLGPLTQTIDKRSDLTAYTVASGSYIYSNEQKRPSIPVEELQRAMYEEEPVVAQRTVLVDKFGNKYDDSNPLPVSIPGGGGGSTVVDLELRFDQVSTNLMYLGEAIIGSLESQAKWKIRKVEIIGAAISIKWASGNFDQIWNDRAGLIYV